MHSGTRRLNKAGLGLALVVMSFPGPGWPEKNGLIREVKQPPRYQWTQFVQVAGQPNPVPVEWVETPEGRYAHSIVIPNPVPKDSGYRWWWSAKRYHQHLCETEAGEFIFKTVDNVEGLLFMRPPKRPSDFDLKDARKLEAPTFEMGFGGRPSILDRGRWAVNERSYQYVEEPAMATNANETGFLRASGPMVKPKYWLRDLVHESEPTSRYGVTWRGVLRYKDRESGIAGHEILVIDLRTKEVLGIARDYGITGKTSNTRDGIWWLNAPGCPSFAKRYQFAGSEHLRDFVRAVLVPARHPDMGGQHEQKN
jgi:hypothetical protein